MNKFFSILTASLAGCFGALLVVNFYPRLDASSPSRVLASDMPYSASFTAYPPTGMGSMEAPSFVDAAKLSVDAVVHVKTLQRSAASVYPWFELFGYGVPERIAQGSGSGVIINGDGYIVTNNHVIDGAERIEVSLNNNRSYEAEVIGADPATDIALLKISAETVLPSLEFGPSESVQIGEWVLAVGNPFDLTSTVTAGIVSAKTRDINILQANPYSAEYPIESFIQTDAAVNPGNSGGALVNASGQLIGINTAIASRTGSYSGYSFAVPSSIVKKVTGDLLNFGEVKRAYLGIQIEPVNEALANKLGLDQVAGCAIIGIVPASGADDAGLSLDDVVLAIDNAPISNFPALQERIAKYHPGDIVQVEIYREGKTVSVPVQLKDRKGRVDSTSDTAVTSPVKSEWIEACEAGLKPVNEGMKQSLGIQEGLQVVSLSDGKFAKAGIRKGFIVMAINGERVKTANQVRRFFDEQDRGLLIEGIYPNGEKAYYGVGTSH